MSETWARQECPHCSAGNQFCLGDMMDITGKDVELAVCWQCKKKFIVVEDIEEYLKYGEYSTEEELLEYGHDVDGEPLEGQVIVDEDTEALKRRIYDLEYVVEDMYHFIKENCVNKKYNFKLSQDARDLLSEVDETLGR